MNKILRKCKKTVQYVKKNGIRKALVHTWEFKDYYRIIRAQEKTAKMEMMRKNKTEYMEWLRDREPDEAALRRQKRKRFSRNIKFSIIVPLYNTPVRYLEELITSVKNQTYSNYELCFADGSSDGRLKTLFDRFTERDKKIKYVYLDGNRGISGNTNEALKMATGDFVVLADHDDLLAPNALYEFALAVENDGGIEVLYSDEDKISMDGKVRFEPHFKPDFNIDLLCSVNYICHLFAAKRELIEKTGGFDPEYDGAQDYDFIFRCVEKAGDPGKVYHVPKVLYHWRSHMDSTAENPESKLYAFEAGRRAVEAHFNRIGIKAQVSDGEALGLYHATVSVVGNPTVSIIIPNKDHTDDLDKCLDSIYEKTEYGNYEVIIIENNSTEEKTFEYYDDIRKSRDNLKVITWDKEFNYAAINNYGAKFAGGEYLLFLNNDTEVINKSWLGEMLGYCQRNDVGAVGARLYYPDDTIQHAGVVIGFGGIAGHTFIGQPRHEFGYFARAMCTQDYSAVTAACMMTKKELFFSVGGFTKELKVAFNDIDYCMKLREKGKLIVYNSYAELYHYESKSRGLEDTKEKVERFNREVAIFRKRWQKELEAGDPYYNRNLALNRSDFALRNDRNGE